MDDDVRLIPSDAVDLGNGEKLDPEVSLVQNVRGRADKGRIHLLELQQPVHLLIGPTVDHLGRDPHLGRYVIYYLLVVFHGVDGGDDGGHPYPQGALSTLAFSGGGPKGHDKQDSECDS